MPVPAPVISAVRPSSRLCVMRLASGADGAPSRASRLCDIGTEPPRLVQWASLAYGCAEGVRYRPPLPGAEGIMAQTKPRAVIDADGHVVEPSDLWARFLPQKLRARAPRFVTDERGRPSLLIDDRIAMRAAMLLTLGPNYDFARLAKARP